MEFDYSLIQRFCTRFLVKELRERHLEDLIQYVAMEYWARDCKANLEWLCIDYLRINGIGKRGKVSAKTLESAHFVGLENDESEDVSEMAFLFNGASELKSVKESEMIHATDNLRGALEEFLSPIKFDREVLKWVLENYKMKKLLR